MHTMNQPLSTLFRKSLSLVLALGTVVGLSVGSSIFQWARISRGNQKRTLATHGTRMASVRRKSPSHNRYVLPTRRVNESYANETFDVRPRIFEPWPLDQPLPCLPPERDMSNKKDVPATSGFLFLKTFKTASSTSAGVNLRIAKSVAQRENHPYPFCQARFDHAKRWDRHGTLYANRTLAESFLWAIIREPTKRAISQFFHFQVSRAGVSPTDENFRKFLKRDMFKNYYIRSLSTRRVRRNQTNDHTIANEIMQAYNFIGVSERINESYVVLSMLLNIPLGDTLYLSAKINGGYDAYKPCTYIQPSFVSTGMQNFFSSDVWKTKVDTDLALYRAVNRSLDMTIDYLGREEFERRLDIFRHALAVAEARCGPTAVFPCDRNGHINPRTSCLWKDSGCGTTCLDQVAIDLGINQ